MIDWTLRPAQAGDAAALTACIAAAYADHAGRIPDLPPVTEGIADDIRDNWVCAAEADGRIVGGAVLVLGPGKNAKLANLAVHPDAGGQGLGRALVAAAEDRARHAGAAELRLTTHAAMPATVRFYERLGWRRSVRHGNAVEMRKTL